MTGTRYVESPLLSVSVEETPNRYMPSIPLMEYRVEVKLGQRVIVQPSRSDEAVAMVRRGISDLIFGEFRQVIRDLEYKIYDRDWDGARKLVHDLEREMFKC
jgi:hypothetical protein